MFKILFLQFIDKIIGDSFIESIKISLINSVKTLVEICKKNKKVSKCTFLKFFF